MSSDISPQQDAFYSAIEASQGCFRAQQWGLRKDASKQGAWHIKGITLYEIWSHELAISHLSLAEGIKLLYKQLSM